MNCGDVGELVWTFLFAFHYALIDNVMSCHTQWYNYLQNNISLNLIKGSSDGQCKNIL